MKGERKDGKAKKRKEKQKKGGGRKRRKTRGSYGSLYKRRDCIPENRNLLVPSCDLFNN